MVMSSPYDVPPWMPAVPVSLFSCITVLPPISASMGNLFADFIRTHRGEWSVHKRALLEGELECVFELMVAPSDFA
jgi:proteasome activator subunit 4